MRLSPPLMAALAAALLFGISTPLSKVLLGAVPPLMLAGLLYLGSGLGLALLYGLRARRVASSPRLTSAEWRRLLPAIIAGGMVAPVLLLQGLKETSAADASLLLNLEGVCTALLAWWVFGEHAGRRIVLGMALIVAGGVALAWPQTGGLHGSARGALLVAAACLAWALDNNFTRAVAAADSVFIAGTKGAVAGVTNVALALLAGQPLPRLPLTASAMSLGLVGYGLSLVLFVQALRGLGAARTGAYFATAPFIGAAVAVGVLHEPLSYGFCFAALLMATGVWLHLTEHHEHEHTHAPLMHTHAHRHDLHHQHAHAFAWDGSEPHSHPHRHEALTHRHPHFPDLHHRHGH
jgi:drug/metabolite transporter (DMT)-like permease